MKLNLVIKNFKRIFRKEQKIRIYNDIQDDDMYKELNTQKSNSDDELNQSIDNTSILIDPMENPNFNKMSDSGMTKSMIRSHTIRNKSRSDFMRGPSRSMIFDDEVVNRRKVSFKRKNSEYQNYPLNDNALKLEHQSVIVGTKVVRSVRNFSERGVMSNLLMNSGLSPQVTTISTNNKKLDKLSEWCKEGSEEVLKKFIALNKRIENEKRIRKKTKKPALDSLFNVKKEEFDTEFVSLNCQIQIIKSQNEKLLDEIKEQNEKINEITQEINIKNVTKSDFTRRLSQINLSNFKLN